MKLSQHGKLKADVVVIGGGVIGTAVAYHLACRRATVILVEKGDLAAEASGACDGLVFLQSKKPGIHLQLAMESRKRFGTFCDRLPLPVEYRACGGMVLVEDETEYRVMANYVRDQQRIGLDVQLLDTTEAQNLEPALSRNIAGAAVSSMDGQVNPIALTQSLALGAQHLGAQIMTHTTVTGIRCHAGRITGIDTERGLIAADAVVNAAGVYAPQVGAMVGLHIPVRPRRGQILVTQAMAPMISRCMISARYIAAKYDAKLGDAGGEGISIEQTESGNLLLGSTREFVGVDRRTTIHGMRRIAKNACGLIPALRRMNVIRSFAGLRPHTPDGLPILGAVRGLTGFFMAAGHEGDGIALSLVTGHLLAQLITTGQTDIPVDAFGLDRFDDA